MTQQHVHYVQGRKDASDDIDRALTAYIQFDKENLPLSAVPSNILRHLPPCVFLLLRPQEVDSVWKRLPVHLRRETCFQECRPCRRHHRSRLADVSDFVAPPLVRDCQQCHAATLRKRTKRSHAAANSATTTTTTTTPTTTVTATTGAAPRDVVQHGVL